MAQVRESACVQHPTLSSRFSGIHARGPNNWDLSLIKTPRSRKKQSVEVINALNHAQLTARQYHSVQHGLRNCDWEFAGGHAVAAQRRLRASPAGLKSRAWSLYIFPLICFIGCTAFFFRFKSGNVSFVLTD